MTTTPSRLGVTAVALATVVAGLAVGPAATAAPSTDASPVYEGGALPSSSFVGPLVLGSTTTAFTGAAAEADGSLELAAAITVGDAASSASAFRYPGVAQQGPVTTTVEGAERCLTLGDGADAAALLAVCDGSPAQTFTWVEVSNPFASGHALARADSTTTALQYVYPQRVLAAQRLVTADVYPAELAESVTPPPVVAPFEVTNPDVAQIAAGYAPNEAFTFSGTGTKGSPVEVRNAKGLLLGTTTVDASTGTWSWTRANMGTYVWTIDFVQDAGTTSSITKRVAGFGPGEVAPAPGTPVVLTNPADPAAGYVPNRAFTFEGTARAGAPVVMQNAKGLVLGSGTADATTGAWAITIPNMKQYVYTADFIADKGQPTEQATRLAGFAPIAEGALVVTSPDAAEVAAGYTAGGAYTFEGAGKKGSTVTIRNAKGLLLGTTTVDASTGTWSWTRTNMQSYVWTIKFVQDEGTAAEQVQQITGFAPTA